MRVMIGIVNVTKEGCALLVLSPLDKLPIPFAQECL